MYGIVVEMVGEDALIMCEDRVLRYTTGYVSCGVRDCVSFELSGDKASDVKVPLNMDADVKERLRQLVSPRARRCRGCELGRTEGYEEFIPDNPIAHGEGGRYVPSVRCRCTVSDKVVWEDAACTVIARDLAKQREIHAAELAKLANLEGELPTTPS